jgi:hypothetical protein
MDVPVTYMGQPVPGVMGQIEQLPDGTYDMTVHHVMVRDRLIEERIRQLFGFGQHQGFTPQSITSQGIDYILAVPLPVAAQAPGAVAALAGHIHNLFNQLMGMIAVGPEGGAGGGGGGGGPNIYANAPHIGELPTPNEAQAPIGLNIPAAGTEMVNFHGEHDLGRVYTQEDFNKLPIKAHGRKENPITRRPIQPGNVRYYRLSGGTKRRGRGRCRRTHKRN